MFGAMQVSVDERPKKFLKMVEETLSQFSLLWCGSYHF